MKQANVLPLQVAQKAVKASPRPDWHPEIRAYITEVDQCLQGSVPREASEKFAFETAFWLERQMRDLILDGMDSDEAAKEAVRLNGSAQGLAANLLQDYFECSLDSPVSNSLGRSNSVAGAIFGMANVLYLAFLQLKVYLPVTSAIDATGRSEELRHYLPAPLPYPDFSWQFYVSLGYPILAPIIAGWICGRFIPVGAAAAVYRVMALIIISALLLGALLLPDRSGILYAVFLAVFWLPIGCLFAHLSSMSLQRKRRRLVQKLGGIQDFEVDSL